MWIRAVVGEWIELFLLRIVSVQSAAGAYPKDAGTIFIDGKHVVLAQAVGVNLVLFKMVELPGLGIVLVEPAAICADPNPALSVFRERTDRIMTQAIFVGRVVFEV